ELESSGVLYSGIAGGGNNGHLQAQAEAEIRLLMRKRVLGRLDFAFQAALAEASGHNATVEVFNNRTDDGAILVKLGAVNPGYVDIDALCPGSAFQRFENRCVSIGIVHVFGYEPDFYGPRVSGFGAPDDRSPILQVGLLGFKTQ